MTTNGRTRVYTAVVEYDPESKMYIASVPGLQAAHTQAATMEELRANLKEVIELCLEEFGPGEESISPFVGLQQIEVEV